MSSLTTAQLESAIRQLLRHFGNQLDKEVLENVLEMCGGDVQQTITFLSAQSDNDYVDPGPSQKESIPGDYMNKPANYTAPKGLEEANEALGGVMSIRRLLLAGDAPFGQHMQSIDKDYPHYTAVLLLLLHKGVELTMNTKARVLAACWQLHKWDLAEHLLSLETHFGLPEVLKALKILDGPRKMRALEKRLAFLQKQASVKPKTLGLVRAKINDLTNDLPGVGEQRTSVTGALAKRIKKWVSVISKEQLEFFALQLPKEPWQELSDIVHLHPKDFQVEWFLSVSFGAAPPEDSILVQAQNLLPENAHDLVAKYRFPYSFLRKHLPDMSAAVKAQIANYEKLDTLVWYYEELASPEVDAIIGQRLDAGEKPKFSYGKLMERLLHFKHCRAPFYDKLVPIAQERLKDIVLPLEPPVVVLGDASYSMDIAIRTATIIGSLLAALTKAELHFFNVKSFAPKVLPRTIPDVIDVATNTQADGLTAPACALWRYYEQKTVVRFFIVVTDEIENEKSKGEYFAQLFYKYYTEVFPAKIVFVSFLENSGQKGRMVRSLENLGIVPLQFRLDSHRPDLTKVDTLLGLLVSECAYFGVQAESLAEALTNAEIPEAQRLQHTLAKLKDLPLPAMPKSKAEEEEEEEEAHEDAEAKGKGKEKMEVVGGNNKNNNSGGGSEDVPEEFTCPITHEVMSDPVVASDGHIYDRRAIEQWIDKQKAAAVAVVLSPMTNTALETTKLYPNYSLKSRIDEWRANRERLRSGEEGNSSQPPNN